MAIYSDEDLTEFLSSLFLELLRPIVRGLDSRLVGDTLRIESCEPAPSVLVNCPLFAVLGPIRHAVPIAVPHEYQEEVEEPSLFESKE